MNNEATYKNWRLEKDNDNIIWAYIDRQGASVNSLNQEVLAEFSLLLDQVAQQSAAGLIILSAKSTGFIAGADIEQFTVMKEVDEAFNLLRQGQLIYDKLEALKIPSLALIDGFCLGGGMELALACRYRIADDSDKTKLGLPEVSLGIHPGWGGTIRLPKLIGVIKAMDLILTGRLLGGKAAYRLGMVDAAVPKRHLLTAARQFILTKPAPHSAGKLATLCDLPFVRPLLGKVFYRQTAKKARPEHYPAPFAVINNWIKEGLTSPNAYITEAREVAKLMLGDTGRNLVRVFFLQNRMKSLNRGIKFDVQHVHVVGAGTMGGDIAAWCALRGMRVTLQDRESKLISPAIKRAYDLYKKKLKEPRLIQEAMDRLMPDPQGLGVSGADVIIEAIFENLAAKQMLFKEIEARAKPEALLATNTSSIPLDEINSVLKNPERLVGIHFFNPVPKMQLVEVVQAEKTAPAIVGQALAFVRKLDKLPLPVKSKPGFLVNRVLLPYLMEAVTLLSEGVPAAAIDKAAVEFGMPMGPIELADTVGLDVCLYVGENLAHHFGNAVPELLKTKVTAKELGRKTGKGFYEYKQGSCIKPALPNAYQAPADLTSRLISRMTHESAACLRDGVVADADLLDAGMIFGTGFAPFRGGPMNYSKNQKTEQVAQPQNSVS